ncbi:MAG TPA: Gfo/Idh/MocA family oxidoreductase [Thermoanaerobaculia bacterium]|nr:Gfo/Idh/MocA family oxidoreductase [Thermoanaerobaculia bacterium]
MQKVRLAVLGCGAVAQINHLPAISASERAEAVVLVDSDPGRARAMAERFGVPETATDYREVLDRIDAAVVALPNSLHAPVAVDLLRRGISVLVEKPMALTAGECDEMIAAAEAGGATLAVGLDFRFFGATRWVKDFLAEGLLGELRGFDLRQGVIPRWPFATGYLLRKETAGGGVLADFGVHVLDLLLVWLGDWASVDYRDDAEGGIESDCDLLLRMRSGVKGVVEVSRTRNLRNTCIFEGEHATLEVGIWDPDPTIVLRWGDRDLSLSGHARAEGTPKRTFEDVFVDQIDDFAEAVREGRQPRVSGREGRRSIELIEACYAARQPLELPWSNPPELAAWEAR